jgi:hypothetical protein
MHHHRQASFVRTFAISGTIAVFGLSGTTPSSAVGSDPAPGTSEYQPWPAAALSGDQQAAEQQNFNTYYSNPIYAATDPATHQRNADVDQYFIDIFGDLTNINRDLDAAARSPYASDISNLGRQMTYLLHASGPNIDPLPATDIQELDEANRWLQSMDLTVGGIANPDPATAAAVRELTDRIIPNYLEDHYYAIYVSQGYRPAQARDLAKQDFLMVDHSTRILFHAAQVAQLRNWYYNGVEYLDDSGSEQSTRLNFNRVAEHAAQTLETRTGSSIVATTIKAAVEGIGAYAPGRIDANGFPFPDPKTTPIANQCPTGYTCPPLADPPT